MELALIKLAYLNQALHLSQNSADKKKGTEGVKPVAYRMIAPLEIKGKKLPDSGWRSPAKKICSGSKIRGSAQTDY